MPFIEARPFAFHYPYFSTKGQLTYSPQRQTFHKFLQHHK